MSQVDLALDFAQFQGGGEVCEMNLAVGGGGVTQFHTISHNFT